MCKVEYTPARCRKLADAVVENMDLKDMIQAIYEHQIHCFEQDEDTFQELWHNYYGNEDMEMREEDQNE